jgi:hypothetical protein
MYRPEEIKAGLLNLWGWRQHHDTNDFTIANSLTESSTGQYYQEVHPLVTLDNIKSIAPDFSNITYPNWSENTQYRKGDRVTFETKTYRALIDNLATEPETNPSAWERFDAFSEWLEQKTEASILKAIRSFWDEKMVEKTAKNILESKTLFNGTGRITDLIPTGENLVGFELVPIRANGITTKIEKVGLQMTGQGNVRMYLMHSSRRDPIKIFDFNRIRNGSIQWFDVEDLFLPYVSDEVDAGGSWYLVYKQADLQEGVQAVSKDKDWSKRPCATCDYDEVSSYNAWSKYLEVHPFKTSAFQTNEDGDFDGDFNGDFASVGIELWDVSKNLYTYTTNYGINLQVSIECDITDVIIQQKKAFQNIVGLQVAVDMIREFTYNPNFRIGRAQQNFSRMELLYELDGDSQSYKKSGLVHALSNAMKAVKLDVNSLSRVCFPCNNRGVRFKTV